MPAALPTGNTHPNGKWFIAIHEVQAVYGRDEPLPLQAFVMGGLPAGTSVQSLVTVQHVADAMKAWPGQPATEPMPQPEHKPEPELVTVTPLAPTPRPAPAQARAATRPQRGVRRQHSATQTTRTTSFTPETTGPSHQGGSIHLAASLGEATHTVNTGYWSRWQLADIGEGWDGSTIDDREAMLESWGRWDDGSKYNHSGVGF